MSTVRDSSGRSHRAAGSPASTGGQYAAETAPGQAGAPLEQQPAGYAIGPSMSYATPNPHLVTAAAHISSALAGARTIYDSDEAFVLADQDDASTYVVATSSNGETSSATISTTDAHTDLLSALNAAEWETGWEA